MAYSWFISLQIFTCKYARGVSIIVHCREREAKKRYTVPCEGEFLFDKLLVHLEAYSAERIVSISEDATRVVSRVEYDDSSDKIVGFVLPLNNNGLPKKGLFHATYLNKCFLLQTKHPAHMFTWFNLCHLMYLHSAWLY